LIAAIGVITVLLSGGILVIVVGFALGLVVSVTSAILFTATGLRSFFESDSAKPATKPQPKN
jgi:hypothetical protein